MKNGNIVTRSNMKHFSVFISSSMNILFSDCVGKFEKSFKKFPIKIQKW